MTTYYNAEFAAEYIVKRDPEGNWCKPSTDGSYASLITGLNGYVYCMAEGPDGKIYVGGAFTDAGGTTDADKLARWNPTSEAWEKVVAGVSDSVYALAFDANGDLHAGGYFRNLGSTDGSGIVKITDLDGTPTVNALGTGISAMLEGVESIAIDSSGNVYIGGSFTNVGGVADTVRIAKWDGSTWSALVTGLSASVYSLAFAPDGELYIGGDFTNASTDSKGDYLCRWNGSAFSPIWEPDDNGTELNGAVYSLAFDEHGKLYVGGAFTNAGGIASADYIARWNGASWGALESGVNGAIYTNKIDSDGFIYVSGAFTVAGGLTLTDRVAVWSNGAWQPLDIDLPGTAIVYSILPASDGSLYIGGAFSTTVSSEDAVCGISYEVEVAEEIEEDFDAADLDPVDSTGV